MPSKLVKGESRNKSKQETVECPSCKVEIPFRQVHCNGSAVAWGCDSEGPHHGSQLWPDCWKCGNAMGCTSCVAGGYRKQNDMTQWLNANLICKRCRVKVTVESFLNGGPISRFSIHFDFKGRRATYNEADDVPDATAYPGAWRDAYSQQEEISGYPVDYDERPGFELLLRMLRRSIVLQPRLGSGTEAK